MRRTIQIIYKCLWMLSFTIQGWFTDHLFRLLLWLNNINFGKNVHSGGGVARICVSKDARSVSIGNNVSFNAFDAVSWYSRCCIVVRPKAVLEIGDNSGFNGSLIYAANSIKIGCNVKIGGGTRIMDSDFHPLDYIARRNSFEGMKTSPITIEDDVFVGTNCIIGKGVHIGACSIIAAGSVVVKDVPADEIWGGNPAKFIRKINQYE